MNATRVETVIETDGELHLSHLPCRKGDHVEAIVLVLNPSKEGKGREEARQRFLARAAGSRFYSQGVYPTRDELHERP